MSKCGSMISVSDQKIVPKESQRYGHHVPHSVGVEGAIQHRREVSDLRVISRVAKHKKETEKRAGRDGAINYKLRQVQGRSPDLVGKRFTKFAFCRVRVC